MTDQRFKSSFFEQRCKTKCIYLLLFLFLFTAQSFYAQVNNCLDFDGINDYVELTVLGSHNNISSLTLLTIEMWVNIKGWTPWGTFFGKYYNEQSRIQIQEGANSGELYVRLGINTYGESYGKIINAPVTSGIWFHLAMVYDGTKSGNENRLKLYIDGQLQTLDFTGTIPSTTHGAETAIPYLGCETPSVSLFYGKMDEVRIWNSEARTQAKIQENMHTSLGTTDNLLASFNFNEGTGTRLHDISGDTDHYGTLKDFALSGSTSNWLSVQASSTPSGSGIFYDPYLISNLDELNWISLNSTQWGGKFFKQTANIDASNTKLWNSGAGWLPIGTYDDKFTGTYDGDGHTITGLYINRPTSNSIGFFGFAGSESSPCTIKNLGLVGVNITGEGSIGGIAGNFYKGTISQCYTTGSVSGNWDYVGGLVGDVQNTTTISDCYSTASVLGRSNVGGFIGNISNGTILHSYSTGSVTTNTPLTSINIGGFVGLNTSGSATASFWIIETSGQSTSALGEGKSIALMNCIFNPNAILTYFDAVWKISDCDPTWNIRIGRNNGYPFLQWQYPTDHPAIMPPPSGTGTSGDPYIITNVNNLLWIVGDVSRWVYHYEQTADIDMSCSKTWDSGYGWLPIGNATTKFTGSYDGNGHTITGLNILRPATSNVGLFGYTGSSCVIKELGLNDAKIYGENATGGLGGYIDNSTINECGLSNVNIKGRNNTGGLGGYISNSTVNECFTTGSVDGLQNVGGLAGSVFTTTISDCYSTSSVRGEGGNVGGLIGSLTTNGTVNSSFSIGYVYCDCGGLVGYNNGGTENNSFWDTETSYRRTSAVGIGKTTAEMKTPSTFSAWSGTVWGIEGGYPFLLWQYPYGSPLPVELSTFTAISTGSTVILNWNTATEVNNYGFEVLRQNKNEEEWINLGFVTGNGNSNSIKSYSFTDDFSVTSSIHSDKFSYKLKQIDNEGQFYIFKYN